MTVSASKIAGGLLLLVGIWIGVYWWWQPGDPKITFSNQPAAAGAAVPARLDPPVPSFVAPVPTNKPPATPAGTKPADKPATAPSAGAPNPAKAAPAATTAPATPVQKVKPPEFWEHVVTGGETLQSISTQFYRTPEYAAAISRANPLMDPTKLKPGKTILIPVDPRNIQGLPQTSAKPVPEARPPAASAKPAPAAKRTYKVQEGDTLSDISKKFYGTSGKTRLIYEANKDKMKSEDALRVGVELVIPELPPEPKNDASKGPG